MSNLNQLLYFASQTYRQVQLSLGKGKTPYAYSDFANQFNALLDASHDEAYARHLTIQLVEEAAKHSETTDYLRQEMAFEAQPLTIADRPTAIALDQTHQHPDLTQRRSNRQANPITQPLSYQS